MSGGRSLTFLSVVSAGVIAAIFFSLGWLDIPVARLFAVNMDRFSAVGNGLGSAVLVSGELVVMAGLVAVRLATGRLPLIGKAMLVAIVTSLTAFTANDMVLKVIFGMSNPARFLFNGVDHGFHLLQGSRDSSFPSGHMALAASFVFTFVRLYRPAKWPLAAALLLAGTALIVGDWHFLSDVIAGTSVGAAAGLAASELWLRHSEHQAR